jgi:integrase
MPVRRNQRGQWVYRKVVKLWDGRRVRVFGTPQINTKLAAEKAEREHVERVLNPPPERPEVPTYEEWFNGRFWREWVIGNQNKPSEVEAKKSIYDCHLGPAFGEMTLDQIDVGAIADFRAKLVTHNSKRRKKRLSRKRVNNVLAVLSKSLRYAAEVGLIDTVPRVGLFKIERPEVEFWDFEEYARILASARLEGPEWFAAVCLAGEAGLRVGEIRALKWREHVDLVAGTITVSEQTRHGVTGTPKGGRRRVVPMTAMLVAALKALDVVRVGYVIRNSDGSAATDGQTTHSVRRIIRRAGLPERGWHSLRHSFGTHAALLGVNPWRLQAWMGHQRIDETMLYVHVAATRQRPLPPELRAVSCPDDPDQRIVHLLGLRGTVKWSDVSQPDRRGTHVASGGSRQISGNEKGRNLGEVTA